MSDATRIAVDERLQRLLDESDIRAVLARYVRGNDRLDWDMMRSCYHDDGTDAHGSYNGPIDGFIEWSQKYNTQVLSKTHHLAQSTIELDGDTAWVETYCLCLIRMKGDDGTLVDRLANIRYVDLFERRDGEWRISHRKVIHHPGRIDPVGINPTFAERALMSRMDADDPSYDRQVASFLP